MSMCSVTDNLNLIPPPGFRCKQVCTYSSWAEFEFFTPSLPVPLVFKPAKRNYLPDIRLQGQDAQYVVWTPHSPGRILEFCILLFLCPSWGTGPSLLTALLLPDFVCIFFIALIVWVFLPVSGLFSVRIALHVHVRLIHSCTAMTSISSYSTSWYPSPIFTIIVDDLFRYNLKFTLCVYIISSLCGPMFLKLWGLKDQLSFWICWY